MYVYICTSCAPHPACHLAHDVYIRIYVYIHAHTHTNIPARTHAHTHTHTHTRTHTHKHTHTRDVDKCTGGAFGAKCTGGAFGAKWVGLVNIRTYTYVYIYIYIYITSMYIYISTHAQVGHLAPWICVHVYKYIYVCMNMHICILTHKHVEHLAPNEWALQLYIHLYVRVYIDTRTGGAFGAKWVGLEFATSESGYALDSQTGIWGLGFRV